MPSTTRASFSSARRSSRSISGQASSCLSTSSSSPSPARCSSSKMSSPHHPAAAISPPMTPLTRLHPHRHASLSRCLSRLHRHRHLPRPRRRFPHTQLRRQRRHKHQFTIIVADPATATIHPQPRTWVKWVHDLHVYLFSAIAAYGEQVNGVGAAILLLLSITGIFLWWQGLARWTRGLTHQPPTQLAPHQLRLSPRHRHLDPRHRLLVVSLRHLLRLLQTNSRGHQYAISPSAGNGSAPTSSADASTGPHRAPLQSILDAAQQASPQGRLFSPSATHRSPAQPSMRRWISAPRPTSPTATSSPSYHQARGAHRLALWPQPHPRRLVHLVHASPPLRNPLGPTLQRSSGFSSALASRSSPSTGLLMYWNRYLRHYKERLLPSRRLKQ